MTWGEVASREPERSLASFCTPILESHGFELVGIEYRSGKHGVLRLFIDRVTGDDGVTIDDCAKVSRMLGAALDGEDVIKHHYVLEVSSPGVERPLIKVGDFTRFKGKKARVVTQSPIGAETFFLGMIEEAGDDAVSLACEQETVSVPYEVISRANLEFEFEKRGRK